MVSCLKRSGCVLAFLVLMFAVGVVLFMFVYPKTAAKNDVVLVKSESTQSDFRIKGQTVYFDSFITLQNRTETKILFTMSAIVHPLDRGRLLKSGEIYAVDDRGEKRVFSIAPNTKTSFDDVIFSGEYAGTPRKWNRNMYTIRIIKIE